MARFVVTSAEDGYGDTPKDRFLTRREADEALEDARRAGKFARLVRWIDDEPKEMARVNDHMRPAGEGRQDFA